MLNRIGNANETLFKIPYEKCQLKDDYATYTVTDKIALYVKIKLFHNIPFVLKINLNFFI